MVDELKNDLLRSRVREVLRRRSVKLWLPPYCVEGKSVLQEIELLAGEYSDVLNVSKHECIEALCFLQENSISRLREREQFHCSGLATLRVRICGADSYNHGIMPSTSNSDSIALTSAQQLSLEIFLSATGKDLVNMILLKAAIGDRKLKLICNGSIIKEDIALSAQNVAESSVIMALILNQNYQDVEDNLADEKLVEDTMTGVKQLQQSNGFEIEDQKGNLIHVPKEERNALVTALALYERGRAALKRGAFPRALILFLVAEKEFSTCNQDLLKLVDNAALLNLDIVWCYLCLRSVTHLPDAERRLQECKKKFAASYGSNMERLIANKGTSCNEAALIMRLNLMQAIILFHKNQLNEAKSLLNEVEQELKRLKVRQEDVQVLSDLGYTKSEALLGLRACNGDKEAAVEVIQQWQKDRMDACKKNRAERALIVEREKLGRTADGSQYIDPSSVERIVGMGFDREIVISALHFSNNNMTQAVQLIQEQPHLVRQRKHLQIDPEVIAEVAAMGFDTDIAHIALRKHYGDIEKAVEDLIQNGGIVEYTSDSEPQSPPLETKSVTQNKKEKEPKLSEKEALEHQRKMQLAADEVADDLKSTSEVDDYLIISLEAEEQFLNEYKALLN